MYRWTGRVGRIQYEFQEDIHHHSRKINKKKEKKIGSIVGTPGLHHSKKKMTAVVRRRYANCISRKNGASKTRTGSLFLP